MIVIAQLNPLILEGLWENATDLFYSWHFCSVRHCKSKDAERDRRKSECVCVCVCECVCASVYTFIQRDSALRATAQTCCCHVETMRSDFDELAQSFMRLYSKYKRVFSLLFSGLKDKMWSDTWVEANKDHAPVMEQNWELGSSMIHNYITATKSLCWVQTHVHTRNLCLLWAFVASILGSSCTAEVSRDCDDQIWNNTRADPTILAGW